MGKKQTEALSSFAPSFVAWAIGAAVTGIYFTDWKVIVTKIPFYNTKFEWYFEKLRKEAAEAAAAAATAPAKAPAGKK